MSRLIKFADANQNYVDAAKKDMIKIANSFYESNNTYEEWENEFVGDDLDFDAIIDRLGEELREDEKSIYSDYIYSGKLGDLLYEEVGEDLDKEGKDVDEEDYSKTVELMKAKLAPWDNLGDFIFENGFSDQVFKILEKLHRDVLEDYSESR